MSKTVLITGACINTGVAIVEKFASEGYRVIFTGRSMEKVHAAEKSYHEKFPTVEIIGYHIDSLLDERRVDEESVEKMFAEIDRRGFFVETLVLNAADQGLGQKIFENPLTDFMKVINTNVVWNYCLSEHAARRMKANGGGNIVFLNSNTAYRAIPDRAAYVASKGGQLGLMRALAEALAAVPFETVSMDFIFALPEQTFADLKQDIDTAFAIGANHIAIYPFIDFTFTKSTVKALPKKEKRQLLDAITQYCLCKGYSRNSIWTFSSEEQAGYSSMTRDNFLGFGCSATTLLKDQFKINTFDVEAYCKRIQKDKLPTSLTIHFTRRQRMIYYLFWTAYSTQVDERDFEKFFGVPLKKMYGFELWLAKRLGFATEENGVYRMTLKGAFYYHYYENFYTLSYIDKMWGLMRKEAFPEEMKL